MRNQRRTNASMSGATMKNEMIDQLFKDLRSRLRPAKFLEVPVLFEDDLDAVEEKYRGDKGGKDRRR